MKKADTKTAIPISASVYGLEHDGTLLPSLCAPREMLDYNSGGFEHKGDCYYNCWPFSVRKDHHWKNVEAGIHLTNDIEDVIQLLSRDFKNEYGGRVIITDRCLTKLVAIGLRVHLRRHRTTVITQKLVCEILYTDHMGEMSIIEDSMTTETHGVGKYKYEH